MKFQGLDVFLKFISGLSKREKAVFYLAVIFLSITLVDRLIISPVSLKMKALDKQIKEKEENIVRDLHILAQKDKILAESVKNAPYVGKAKSEEELTTDILKEIENITSKSAVYLVDMKPAGVKNIGSSKKYLVNLDCEASMDQLIDFMYTIENTSKLLTIEKYDIAPRSEESNTMKVSMSISKMVIP
ncbi:MAG: hypothetical protein PHN57_00640 [Candidatus Omnitrophica bacterium]|nr:hypothetical protein [Candidatus Omnitrophota bacterium]